MACTDVIGTEPRVFIIEPACRQCFQCETQPATKDEPNPATHQHMQLSDAPTCSRKGRCSALLNWRIVKPVARNETGYVGLVNHGATPTWRVLVLHGEVLRPPPPPTPAAEVLPEQLASTAFSCGRSQAGLLAEFPWSPGFC